MSYDTDIKLSGNKQDICLRVSVPEEDDETFKIFWTDKNFIDLPLKECIQKTLEQYPEVSDLFKIEGRNKDGFPPDGGIRAVWNAMGGGISRGISDADKLSNLLGVSKHVAEEKIELVAMGLVKKIDIKREVEDRENVWSTELKEGMETIERFKVNELAPSM